jgi:hypothetical protein
MAVLCTRDTSVPVRVRNLSAHGALLEGVDLPQEDVAIWLRRGSLCASGDVAWGDVRHCGIRFATAINVDEWVRRAGPVGQQRIDATVADYRRRDVSPRHLSLLSSSHGREALDQTSSNLLKICERIAGFPNMTVELAEELLKIEAIAHALRSTSNSVR